MFDPVLLLAVPAIALVGVALALSQFCMVRAVLGVQQGLHGAARCVVAISAAITVVLQLLALWHGGEAMPSYAPAAPVLFGGLLFGLAARANGGCYVGSLNELCRGDWRRLFTLAGWVIGFALIKLPALPAHHQRPSEVALVSLGLMALLLILGWRARRRGQVFLPNPALPALCGARAWALMLGCGVLIGLLHHMALPWDPSTLARGLGRALRGESLPSTSACALLVPLAMVGTQWRLGRIQMRRPQAADLMLLVWGTLMSLGTLWGMGANDSYLFRYLPLGSLHAAVGLVAMTGGILMPLAWQKPQQPLPDGG